MSTFTNMEETNGTRESTVHHQLKFWLQEGKGWNRFVARCFHRILNWKDKIQVSSVYCLVAIVFLRGFSVNQTELPPCQLWGTASLTANKNDLKEGKKNISTRLFIQNCGIAYHSFSHQLWTNSLPILQWLQKLKRITGISFGHGCLINTNPRVRHSNIATWTQVSSGANQWNLLFKWSMPKSKPCFNILEKLEPNAKFLSCGVDYNFFSPLLAKLVLWWATRNCSSVKMLLIMTCLTLTIWMVTQFFSLCVNSCLRAQTRQLICVFGWK